MASQNVITPPFRVSYPAVFKPKFNKLSNKEEYSVQALFKKGEDLSKLKAAAAAAIEEKWGKDKTKWPKNLKTPFRDQGDREYEDEATGEKRMPDGYEKGAIYVTFNNKQRPGVVDQKVQPIIDETQFYGGCFAIASVSAFAYDVNGGRGVKFFLQNIQKTKDGQPFGNRTKPQDDFKPIEGAAEENAAGGDATSLFG